jgi:hypothetical protein
MTTRRSPGAGISYRDVRRRPPAAAAMDAADGQHVGLVEMRRRPVVLALPKLHNDPETRVEGVDWKPHGSPTSAPCVPEQPGEPMLTETAFTKYLVAQVQHVRLVSRPGGQDVPSAPGRIERSNLAAFWGCSAFSQPAVSSISRESRVTSSRRASRSSYAVSASTPHQLRTIADDCSAALRYCRARFASTR